MSGPLVSVLMPVYNGERFVEQAIDSILQQTFRDFDYVIVDDGSSDRTPEILERAADPRVHVIRIEHAGLVSALNAGLTRCRGQYLARMDADDVSYRERLGRQADWLQSHREVDVVTCQSDLLDDRGQVVGPMPGGVGPDMLLELASSNDVVHGSVMVRRDALPPPPVYQRPPEDYILWVDLVRRGKRFHAIAEPLYGFRTHPGRHSLLQAAAQSRGIVETQWPLLEECEATRNIADPATRAKLIRGWGTVGGAAYRSGQVERGRAAYRRFRELAATRDERSLAAILTGAEALVWGGCPFGQRLALRLLELRRRPTSATSYRKLLLSLPLVTPLREAWKRRRGQESHT